MSNYSVEPIYLKSGDETLGADLYRPVMRFRKPPLIIMAHGFGAERKFGLPKFAERFAETGYAVLLFDYRCFGGSTGKPRELVSPTLQLEDWRSVIHQARKRKDIDTKRIYLWGTSLSGGHVLTMAAREKGIRAVMAMVPHVDGVASSLLYPKHHLPSVLATATRDLAGSKLGREPIRIPVVAPHGVRCLAGDDCYADYMALVPSGTSWTGRIPARIMLSITRYRPTREMPKIRIPVLLIAAAMDSLIPIEATRLAAHQVKSCEYTEWPMSHFAPYRGEWFEKAITTQLNFLQRQQ